MTTLDGMPKLLSNSKLPDEIIELILMHLPVETLSRFKKVLKRWNFLISSHNFANAHLKNSTDPCSAHLKNSTNRHRLLFGSITSPIDNSPMDMYSCSLEYAVEESDITIYPPLNEDLIVQPVKLPPLPPDRHNILIVGSCNGLVCLLISQDLILWNPTTGQFRTLPNSGTKYLFQFDSVDNLDDSCFDDVYAFGHNFVNDDYNVFQCCQYLSGKILLKIYGVRSNSWRTIDWPGPSGCIWSNRGNGVFCNGEICWLMTQTIETDQTVVNVVFHQLSTDTFMVMPSPPATENSDDNYSLTDCALTVLSGSLAISVVRGTSHLEIWFLKEKAWTNAVHLPFPLGLTDSNFFCPLPLFLSSGRVLINYGSNISVCDSSEPNTHQLGYGHSYDVEATTYTESLISPYLN